MHGSRINGDDNVTLHCSCRWKRDRGQDGLELLQDHLGLGQLHLGQLRLGQLRLGHTGVTRRPGGGRFLMFSIVCVVGRMRDVRVIDQEKWPKM